MLMLFMIDKIDEGNKLRDLRKFEANCVQRLSNEI